MQLMYKDYTFMFMPIIIVTLGTVPKRLESSLKELVFFRRKKLKFDAIVCVFEIRSVDS